MKIETRKRFVKRLAVLGVVVMSLSSLAGCGDWKSDKSSKMKKGSYRDWYEYLKPALANVKITDYEEKDGQISVEIQNESANVNGFAQIASLHNEFVDANPDYFKKGEKFIFSKYQGGRLKSILTSSLDMDLPFIDGWYKGDKQDVTVAEDGKLIYAFTNKSYIDELINNSAPVPIEVLFLKGYTFKPVGWDDISVFTTLKRIVLDKNEQTEAAEIDLLKTNYPEMELILY